MPSPSPAPIPLARSPAHNLALAQQLQSKSPGPSPSPRPSPDPMRGICPHEKFPNKNGPGQISDETHVSGDRLPAREFRRPGHYEGSQSEKCLANNLAHIKRSTNQFSHETKYRHEWPTFKSNCLDLVSQHKHPGHSGRTTTGPSQSPSPNPCPSPAP